MESTGHGEGPLEAKATPPSMGGDEARLAAAATIQRNYRGYRGRRQLQGMCLDPSTRWMEALKEAQYRNLTRPHPRTAIQGQQESVEGRSPVQADAPGRIVRRAEDDDSSDSANDEGLSEDQRQAKRGGNNQEQHGQDQNTKVMGLQYFLEMVDLKHRHGSNLRKYHAVWKDSATTENFFYWLDHGEGRRLDLPACPRDRLEREQVRYLSREERMNYLVKIDSDGRFCWTKNGLRIETSEGWKDSVQGIVPIDDPAPAYTNLRSTSSTSLSSSASSSSVSSSASSSSNPVSAQSKDLQTPKRKRKPPKWIFVSSPSHTLYISLKSRGHFQHSSFLHGSRISCAGNISLRDGRLLRLSPLSGHYRPDAEAFRRFMRSLREQGADLGAWSLRWSVVKGEGTLWGREIMDGITGGEDEVEADKMQKAGKIIKEESKGGVHKVKEMVHAVKGDTAVDAKAEHAVKASEESQEPPAPHHRKDSLGHRLLKRLSLRK
ncbi:MAG: hypothetical protein M1833_002580 [Piccolia ochrophora]|nr:MAG: hypothetical protein M1833_002580 [Piccolia ochrophora]